jgi:energy-coupling factor transport system ATP-binding protein
MRLSCEGVTIRRGQFSLQTDATFSPGTHLITGKVGSGKSTFSLAATGLLSPTSGAFTREGISTCMVTFASADSQATALTVGGEVTSWGLHLHDLPSGSGFDGKADLDLAELSAGERKRLQLACALAKPYDLLVLDEPYAGLDCRVKRQVAAWIRDGGSGIVLLFTHETRALPPITALHEIRDGALITLGALPAALALWRLAPPHIRWLLAKGAVPKNLDPESIREVAWTIHV